MYRTRSGGSRHSLLRKAAPVAAILAFGGVVATGAALRTTSVAEIDPRTGCPAGGHGEITVILADGSDPLGPRNEAALRATVERSLAVRRDARVIIARFTGGPSYQVQILFDRCNPGGAREAKTLGEGPAAREKQLRDNFVLPLQKAIDRLAKPTPKNRQSYVADTIAHAVSDPSLHLDHGVRRLVVMSDLIENTKLSLPYQTGHIRLPSIREKFLSGIAIELIELPAMPGAERLQTIEGRTTWRAWCRSAGAARTRVDAPGLDDRWVV
ncbi:MAG: hypothetical protein QOJ94_1158 [Sphingomonadales bacterium]|jgi:hypothetical protein|nr:hypothetical protein [Sphingomonadales bacterium]